MKLTDPVFHDEAKAREFMESQRWPDCPFALTAATPTVTGSLASRARLTGPACSSVPSAPTNSP